MARLALTHGLRFEDLYSTEGLGKVDAAFLADLAAGDADLAARLAAARSAPDDLDRKAEAELLIAVAPHAQAFIGNLFGVTAAVDALADGRIRHDELFTCKRNFVQRVATRAYNREAADGFDGPALAAQLEELFGEPLSQHGFARQVMAWMTDEAANAEALDLAKRYAAWATLTPAGQTRHKNDRLFRTSHPIDPTALVEATVDHELGPARRRLMAEHRRRRDGFGLTDPGCDEAGMLDNVNYCVFCHERGKDSCSHGIMAKGSDGFAQNTLGVTLAGCPLDERISEMQMAVQKGLDLAALAFITVDNPMAAGTGHRICNDCMKSCIYQKQEPVDIPQVETRVLKDILGLPWGFEIYSLLTRWNPLNLRRPVPLSGSGYKVLVVGLGPAGYTLAHHLLNQGHGVVAVDGLKIEPLPPALSGVGADGTRIPFNPIEDVQELWEDLDDRTMAGFGGVAEYGITVRWDKNFLKVIRLLLERRSRFAMYGGVRFGGTVFDTEALSMGFDHIALCAGAGRPNVLRIPNGLAPGVRQASDFLMGLQLTGAARKDGLANLQLRLPAVVIGGGLTGIDTATEAAAYYIRQVERHLERWKTLVMEQGEEAATQGFTAEERALNEEFLDHGRAVQRERDLAAEEGREPDFTPLIEGWGGVTLAYRRRMIDSPAYRLNHEEVTKALEEGIRFAELLAPTAIEVDEAGHAAGLTCEVQAADEAGNLSATGAKITLPARAVLIAAGTHPNTVLAREHEGFAAMDGEYYQAIDLDGHPVTPERNAKPGETHVLMRRTEDDRYLSFLGDQHPSFAGNVVKAMGSAKRGFPVIDAALTRRPPSPNRFDDIRRIMDRDYRATVHEVVRLTPTIIEVIVRAPAAARAFKPGQFFRLQNFETLAPYAADTRLAMEGLALTGAWVDRERGLVSLIVLEMGGSSSLCRLLKPGEPVVLMGPTGAPTETPAGETVLLVGGGLGNAVLFSIGQAFRAAGSRVLYFAGYKGIQDRFHVENIEAASDAVVWCCDEAPGFKPTRPQDKAITGNIIEALVGYAEGRLGDTPISMGDVDRVVAIGSDGMMSAVQAARKTVLAAHLKPGHLGVGSINSPMQCMMKEICAQCLQSHKDPQTGKETVVFSCFNQDQALDRVDFKVLRGRLCQNRLAEKLTARWIARAVSDYDGPKL